MSTWLLEDVTARAEDGSFFIPSPVERSQQQVGDMVRLHFLLSAPQDKQPRAERMWVKICERTEVDGYVYYRGVLSNQPAFIQGLNQGDSVAFEPCHVARTLIRPDNPQFLPVGEKNAVVSARALEPGCQVRWAYREEPDNDGDSGWRLFAGDESQEYVEDPANARVCNVYWLVDRDPTLFQLFQAELGAAFERLPGEPFVRVEDWQADDASEPEPVQA